MKLSFLLTLSMIFILIKNVNAQLKTDSSVVYTHNQKASLKSKIIQSIFAVAGVKKRLEKYMTVKSYSQQASRIPKSLTKKNDVTISEINGRKIWTLKPKNAPSERTILYIHGGAYILNISSFHWKFIEDLIEKTNATIVVPDYPLAPDYIWKDVYDFVSIIYTQLLHSGILPSNLMIMGDSAGGGFALGFAQYLKEENIPQPSKIVLLSPWLDISMNNSKIGDANQKDKMLGIKGLQLAGKAYAGNLNERDFKVSPLYGNMTGLGEIFVFIGTHDIFIADCRDLKDILIKEKVKFNYFEYPKMFHGWMVVTGLKESKHTMQFLKDIVTN